MAFENVIYYISGMGHNVITGNRILLILCLAIIPGLAQSQKDDKGIPSRKVTFVMPFEFDFDFGAANGNAVIGRFFPRISVPLGRN